jgi:hypothetical protein
LDHHWHWISAAFTAIFYTILNFWAVPSADFPISSEIADVQTNPNKSMPPQLIAVCYKHGRRYLLTFSISLE